LDIKIIRRSSLTALLMLCLIASFPVAASGQTLTPFKPNDPYFKYDGTGTLANFPGQWHLLNQTPSEGINGIIGTGIDANLTGAWNLGYTGKGVLIGIVDDGVEGTHEDIAPNYRADLSRNFSSDASIANAPQGPIDKDENHGQAVAGVAAARGGNSIGGTGAAPYASIVALNPYPGKEINATAIRALYVQAYYWKSGVDPLTGKITAKPTMSIMNHSYGQNKPWNLNDDLHGPDITTALNRTAANGIIHVWSAGNERGQANEDANKDNVLTNSNVIAVAALGSDGKYSSYSNYGYNVFVTAPSSSNTGFGITTTDRTGANLGYNRYSADNTDGDKTDTFPNTSYTSTFGGTSSAAPLVSGILALGMEANKYMDVRMAKHVLAQTSTMVDPDDTEWVKNGAGNWFNPNYGFGNINAGRFVEGLKTVEGVTMQTFRSSSTQTVSKPIEYIDDNGVGGTSQKFTFTTTELPSTLRQPLEGVEVALNFTHSNRGNLTAGIISPYNTKSGLFNSTKDLPAAQQDNVSVTNFSWTFLTNAFWGEDPLGGTDKTSGTWTITMGDKVSKTSLGTWNSYNLTLLMGQLILNGPGTTTQTHDIKARVFALNDSADLFVNPAGLNLEVSEKVAVSGGEMNINGTVKMVRPDDDIDPEDGWFVLDGGIVSGGGIIDAPYGFYHLGGTIKPGNSIGTLTINGDYYQDTKAKILAEVASPTSNDLLAINGSADLDGILQTSWTGGYIPALKTKFGAILTATAGVTGQFSSLVTNITPTVLFKPKYDIPNQVYLVAERDYANQNLIAHLNANQRAIASMLNSAGNAAAGDLNTVLAALDALPAYDQTASALDQIAPKGSEARSAMGISGAGFQAGNLSERLSDLRHGIRGISLNGLYFKNGNGMPVMLASINPDLAGMLPSRVDKRWGFFIKGNAGYGDQKDTPGRTGYDFTSAGITVGSDYRFTKNLIAGLMLGLNTSRANVDNIGSKVKMDCYNLGAYGTWYKKNFYVDGSISYGLAGYDNTRRIVFPGLDRTATASPGGSQLAAFAGTGYDLRTNNWIITPNMSLQYTQLNIDSYTESGAGALNLDVDKQSTESLQGNIGARASYAWQANAALIMPHIRASYGYELLRDSQNITSHLAQGSSPFSIQTAPPDRSFLSLGAGITAFTVRNMSVYISYDVQIGEARYEAHSVNAGFRVRF